MRCDKCKNADICLDHRELKTLKGCTSGIPDRKRLTNADRIRNMSDGELAEFLAYNAYCEECYVKKDDSCCYPDGTCKQKHLEWLQSEAE